MPYQPFGNPYYPANGYAPPMQDQLAQLRAAQYQATQPITQPTPAAPNSGIIWVQGEEGAKAYMVAPGNTVLLMDSDGTSFYLKSADNSGMPLPLRVFDYTERVTTPRAPVEATITPAEEYATRKELSALESRADALAAELEALKSKKPSKKAVTEEE